MTVDAATLARVHIALREGREIEIRYNGIILQTGRGSGAWSEPMIVRTVIDRGAWIESQWHGSAAELIERLEKL